MATLHPETFEPDKPEKRKFSEEKSEAQKSWDRLESEIKAWNERLEDLKTHADTVGREVVNDLDHRYQNIQNEMKLLRQEFADRAEDSIEQTSSTVRKSSKDLFDGVVRAWEELRTGFENAAGRIKQKYKQ